MKFNVFGRKVIEVVRQSNQWRAFDLGNEGKKRLVQDLVIPATLSEQEVQGYLADTYHELATLKYPEVTKLD